MKSSFLKTTKKHFAGEADRLNQTKVFLQLIVFQAIATAVMASVAKLYYDEYALGILWGGFCASLNVLLIIWRMNSRNVISMDASRQLRLMYRSVLERFFIVIGLLVFGMIKLDYMPLGIMLGFVGGQAVMIIFTLFKDTTNKDVNN